MPGQDAFIATYMMASEYRGTIYIGVTGQLIGRIQSHREEALRGFTKRYDVKRLVWFEPFEDMRMAIQREKSLKRWPRQWKMNLIEWDNPHWEDMYPALIKPAWMPPPQWE